MRFLNNAPCTPVDGAAEQDREQGLQKNNVEFFQTNGPDTLLDFTWYNILSLRLLRNIVRRGAELYAYCGCSCNIIDGYCQINQ